MKELLVHVRGMTLLLILLGFLLAPELLVPKNPDFEPHSPPPAEMLRQVSLPVPTAPIAPATTTATALATTTSTTTKKAAEPTKIKIAKATSSSTTPTATPSAPSPITLSEAISAITSMAESVPSEYSDVNTLVRSALVNIICSATIGTNTLTTSGSGVTIDPRGVILTNAHVAQLLLFSNYPKPGSAQCIVRTGSPATPQYTAELMFISPNWIKNNPRTLVDESPTGSGEYDYALLRINGTVSPDIQLPSKFPFLLTSIESATRPEQVLVAGYAAGFLDSATIMKNLYASSAITTIQPNAMTFGTSTYDLYRLGGSVVAQHGSSGGAMTRMNGMLLGTIVTTTEAAQTGDRSLQAISTSYILRTYEAERGKSLASALAGNIAHESASFQATTQPSLVDILIKAISPSN